MHDAKIFVGQLQLVLSFVGSLVFVVSVLTDTNIEFQLGVLIIFILLINLFVRFSFKDDYDGQIVITTTDEGKKLFSLELDGDPAKIESMNSVSFKVTTDSKFGYEEI